MMEFIRSLIFIKRLILTKKNKKEFLPPPKKKKFLQKEEILTDKKDFLQKNRFSRMITNKNKCVQINYG